MAGTNLFTKVTDTLWVCLTEAENAVTPGIQLAMLAKCTGVPPATANLFEHGCLMFRTDSGTGTAALYQNTGSIATPVWTLLDTSLPGDTASSLIDTNSVTALDVGTTASAVNNLRVTNSATGAVGANAVTLSAVGSDAAVSVLVVPKGVTGITTIGLSTGTGDVVLGSSSGTQTVKISNGAGLANTNIAAVGTAGSTTNIASAATADTKTDAVNIATGNSAGTGAKTVHIADGTPSATGINTVVIGSLTNASVTTLQGGTGATAVTVAAAGTGIVTVGGAAQTGDVVLGSSSGTQTVKLGNGAGLATVNLANTSVVGANVNMATAATGAGITDTVAVSTGNAAATGVKVVNILTGTPGTSGNNRLTMGGGATSAVTTNAVETQYFATNRTTGSAVANAPVATLVNAAGANITVATGLRITLTLAAGLQAGANTLNLNSHGADAIKKHTNSATDLGVAYDASGVVDLYFNGTVWLDMSQ